MRPTLTSALCAIAILFTCPLSAQVSQHKSTFKIKHLATAPVLYGSATAAKSTATASRLIAAAGDQYGNSSFVPTDSAFVTYSGSRGGDAYSGQVKFDYGTLWYNTGSGLEETEKMAQVFDANDNILSTLVQEWNGSAWINSYGRVLTYNGNNVMLSETQIEWNGGNNAWDSIYRHTYTYDVNNKLINEVGMSGNGGPWENEYQYINSLDANGNTILSVFMTWNGGAGVWDSMGKLHYVYNVNDLQIEFWSESWQQGGWQQGEKYLTTYNANDLPETVTRQSWNGSGWITARIVTNTYVNNDLVNVLEQYANGDYLANQDMAYDGNHNVLSRIRQHWFNNSFVNSNKMEWTYNSFDQPTWDMEYAWVNNAWGNNSGNYTNRYYYETYTGIEDSKLADNSFKVYPVPAQSFVRVEKTWAQPHDFIVSITDMQGRLIRTFSEKATTNYGKTIDVSQLPSGNYFIKVAATNGKASYQQFSVMH